MSDIRAAADAAKAFADQHTQELAAEIVEWQDTAVLRDGKLRELARLCGFAGNDALTVANHIATLAALEVAARKRPEAEVAEIMVEADIYADAVHRHALAPTHETEERRSFCRLRLERLVRERGE
ncbi:MAG TPA: hypothetical protein VNV16_11845 [Methylibium sp.]|nr:hypothetical protein [Methylibium sp.]